MQYYDRKMHSEVKFGCSRAIKIVRDVKASMFNPFLPLLQLFCRYEEGQTFLRRGAELQRRYVVVVPHRAINFCLLTK